MLEMSRIYRGFYLAFAVLIGMGVIDFAAHFYVGRLFPHLLDTLSTFAFTLSLAVIGCVWLFLIRPQLRQLKERSQLLETVITSANDSIVITKANLDGPGPEITYINQAFTKMTGYSAEEIIGKTPKILQGEFTRRETLDELAAPAGRCQAD